MQSPEEASEFHANCDTPTTSTIYDPKTANFRRIRHVDPRYSMYRWDCGSYPYFKAPLPPNSSCSGIPPHCLPSSHIFPVQAQTAADVCCDGIRGCYGDGHEHLPQPERCICDSRDPRYHLRFIPDVQSNWDSVSVGCRCCAPPPHVDRPRDRRNHHGHVDSFRLYTSAAGHSVDPDVVHVYPARQKSIEAKQKDAPVQYLRDSTGTTLGHDQASDRGYGGCSVFPVEEQASCSADSTITANSVTVQSSLPQEIFETDWSNAGREQEQEHKTMIERQVQRTDEESKPTISITNIGAPTLKDSKGTDMLAGKINSTTQMTAGKITEPRIIQRSSSGAPKVTPLYGLPSWWGDEPETDTGQQLSRNSYSTTAPSQLPSTSLRLQLAKTEPVGDLPVAARQKSFDNTKISVEVTRNSVGSAGIPQSEIERNPNATPLHRSSTDNPRINFPNPTFNSTIFEKPAPNQGNLRGSGLVGNNESPGSLSVFDISSNPGNFLSQENFGNQSENRRSIQHHSPPERDRPSTVGSDVQHHHHHHRRFLYPEPTPGFDETAQGGDYGEECGWQDCRPPTAFVVDLEQGSVDGSTHRITVKTSLSEFLPRRCERSLQRRLSWMKQNQRLSPGKARYVMEDNGERIENKNQIKSPEDERKLKLQESISTNNSFDEVASNDAIADDISEAGTYTIDVSSDGESVAVADARDKILATFGITEIDDAEPDDGAWSESKTSKAAENSNRSVENRSIVMCPEIADLKSPDSDRCFGEVKDTTCGTTEKEPKDPVTPTEENCSLYKELQSLELTSCSGEKTSEDSSCISSSSLTLLLSPSPFSDNSHANTSGLVLTIYTDSASGCIMSHNGSRLETGESQFGIRKGGRSTHDSDSAMRLADTDRGPRSLMACDTWRSQATVDTNILMQDPEFFSSNGNGHAKMLCSGATDISLQDDDDTISCQSLNTTTDSGQRFQPVIDSMHTKQQVQARTSSYPVPPNSLQFGNQRNIRSDQSVLDPPTATSKRSTAASESGDSLESNTSLSFQDFSPRTDASLDTKVLLQNSDESTMCSSREEAHVSNCVLDNETEDRSDLDDDGSSVDPLNDLVTARTVASLTTEVLLKPTEELVQVLGKSKVSKERKYSERAHGATDTTNDMYVDTTRAVVEDVKSPGSLSSMGLASQVFSTPRDKAVKSKPAKTKPPTPKSLSKNSFTQNNQLSTRRCFSDLNVAEPDESGSENLSTPVSEDKGVSGKGMGNSVENRRMNRTFALRCARLENDPSETPRSENVSTPLSRPARTSQKQRGSKFEDIQRSRSASRSRPGMTSQRSLLDSPRSTETGVSLGQRIVRKSQENEKKVRHSTPGGNNSFSRSFARDDESSSVSSQKSVQPFRAPNAVKSNKKKGPCEDGTVGTLGLTVKGNSVQSRPLSGSQQAAQEVSANEWTRRKKYSPKQSMQAAETAAGVKSGKREGKSVDGKPIPGSVVGERTDSHSKNRKKLVDSSAKSVPSTSSDWTDDEKLQLTPRGRDLPAVCQLSAKVKLLSDQVLQAMRKRSEFRVNETLLQLPKQEISDHVDSLEGSPPEFLYIFHNLQAAERQMSAVFQVLSSKK